MMLLDGITCHESTKRKLEVYAANHGKPVATVRIVLQTIVCHYGALFGKAFYVLRFAAEE